LARNSYYRTLGVCGIVSDRARSSVRYEAGDDREDRFTTFGDFGLVDAAPSALAAVQGAGRSAQGEGLGTMIGPLNLSFQHDVGLLVEGFDKPPG